MILSELFFLPACSFKKLNCKLAEDDYNYFLVYTLFCYTPVTFKYFRTCTCNFKNDMMICVSGLHDLWQYFCFTFLFLFQNEITRELKTLITTLYIFNDRIA